jgi:hypothetical protein
VTPEEPSYPFAEELSLLGFGLAAFSNGKAHARLAGDLGDSADPTRLPARDLAPWASALRCPRLDLEPDLRTFFGLLRAPVG